MIQFLSPPLCRLTWRWRVLLPLYSSLLKNWMPALQECCRRCRWDTIRPTTKRWLMFWWLALGLCNDALRGSLKWLS